MSNHKYDRKYIWYFITFVILIAIFYLIGNNLMNIYYKNNKILNEKIKNLENKVNNNIIHKKINNVNLNNNVSETILKNIPIDNWEEKVENHMKYKHGNPLMYNTPVNEIYNDLK